MQGMTNGFFIEELAGEAEQAAARGEMSVVYKITKLYVVTASINQSAPVKDKNGSALTTEQKQADRCVQPFQEVLNLPEPDEPTNPPPADLMFLRLTPVHPQK